MPKNEPVDSHLVQLRIKNAILSKIDEARARYGMTRTQMIIQATLEFIENHFSEKTITVDLSSLESKLSGLEDKMTILDTKLDKTSEEHEQLVDDPKLHAKITAYLSHHPDSDAEDFNDVLGVTKVELLDTLVRMKKAGLVKSDKNGRWRNA